MARANGNVGHRPVGANRLVCAGAALLVLAAGACGAVSVAAPKRPLIRTDDVTRFYAVYEAAGGHPSAAQLDRDYLAPGSNGLHEFAKLRHVTGARIAATIARTPQVYVDARRCLSALPAVKRRLTAAFDKLAQRYPEATFAPVTVLVGRGRPVGITNPSGVSIGLEALCAADFMNPNVEDRFVHVIAHEYGHLQQPSDIQALNPGDPGATVLMLSLVEGAAEFNAELISGDVGNHEQKALTRGREAEIEAAFVKDEDKTDVSHWLYNHPGTPGWPEDLGYWVGYRIVTSYYQHAADKHQALRDIYGMRDPKAFLARSGWHPAAPRGMVKRGQVYLYPNK